MNGKYRILILGLILALLLCGCDMNLDNETVRSGTDALLQGLLAEDMESSYAVVQASFSQEEFREPFRQLSEALNSVETYTLTALHLRINSTNGVSTTTVTYHMETNAGTYIVEATATANVEGLSGFLIREPQVITVTGTLTTMKGANLTQWLVLILGLAEIAFVLIMFVDCMRHKFHRRWLWCLLILFLSAALTCTISPGGIRIQTNLGFFLSVSSLAMYSNGESVLRLMIPLGAMIYLFSRKKLLQPPTPKDPPANKPEEPMSSDSQQIPPPPQEPSNEP